MGLFVPNFTGKEVYAIQATARDGRFTWKSTANGWVPGPVLGPSASLPSELAEALPDQWIDLRVPVWPEDGWAATPELLDLIDTQATPDDTLAWGFAAKWWLNYARASLAGVQPAKQSALAGPLTPGYVAHSNNLTLGCLEVISGYPMPTERAQGDVPWRFGKGYGVWLADDTWPNYFWSVAAQIYAKAAARQVSKLIKIQIALRGASYFLFGYANGIPGIQKVWS